MEENKNSFVLRLLWCVIIFGVNTTYPGITQVALPVHSDYLNRFISVAAGREYSLAIRGDGTLWSWGANESGQLGNRDKENRLLLVQVAFQPNQLIKSVAAHTSHTLAVDSEGTLWGWGSNAQGQLGLGASVVETTTPASILTGVKSAAAGYQHSDYKH